jgi:hypothetical protein
MFDDLNNVRTINMTVLLLAKNKFSIHIKGIIQTFGRAIILLFVISTHAHCGIMPGQSATMNKYEDFLQSKINTFDETDCSPIVDPEFKGIRIQAPTRIPINANFIIPVCGTYQIDEKMEFKHASFINEIVIEVYDVKKNILYSNNLLEPEYEPVILDTPPKGNNDLNEVVVTGWFNVDLYRYITDLPKVAGKYRIQAMIGELKSNIVFLELEKASK